MNEKLSRNILKQNILAQIFSLLMTGSKFCVIGHPQKFSTKKLKGFLEIRGHSLFTSDTEASIFLAANNQPCTNYSAPQAVLLFKTDGRNIGYFKTLGLPVINMGVCAERSDLVFSEVLYILNKIPDLKKKKSF